MASGGVIVLLLFLLIGGIVVAVTLSLSGKSPNRDPSPGPSPGPGPSPSPGPAGQCGKIGAQSGDIQTYVVNGKDSYAGKFPWMVSLGGCGGSVISPKWVLTAAHCQMKVGAQIAAGVFNRAVQEQQRQVRTVTRVVNHPGWNQTQQFANDVCLLEVDQPFTFDRFVAPVCLPAQANLDINNKDLLIMGWGSVTGSMGSSATIMQEAVVRTQNGSIQINNAIQFGAGGSGNVTTCFGDSGGPVVLVINDRATQVGIVSFGSNPCQAPSYYVRVSAFTSWIESIVGSVNKQSGDVDPQLSPIFPKFDAQSLFVQPTHSPAPAFVQPSPAPAFVQPDAPPTEPLEPSVPATPETPTAARYRRLGF